MNLSMVLVGKPEGIFFEFEARPKSKNNRWRKRGGGLIERESPSAVWVLDRAFHIIRCGGSSAQTALEALNKLRLSALFRQVGKAGWMTR